jgi:hypothetical protein
MANRYKVLLPLRVHTEDNSYTQGETFEKDFTAEEEAANIASGLLELVPNEYQVVGDSEVDGHKTGDTYSAAIPLGREALLVAGGHIKRIEKAKKKKEKADK